MRVLATGLGSPRNGLQPAAPYVYRGKQPITAEQTQATAAASATTRKALRRGVEHGTYNGATAHYRRGEKPCDECREAYRTYRRAKDAERRQLARDRAAALKAGPR